MFKKNTSPENGKRKFDSRRLRYGSISTAVTVVVIVGIVLLNVIVGVLGDHFPLNLDLSGEQYYSLSDESKDLVHAVDKDVKIVAFQSESYFAEPAASSTAENTVLREVHSLLDHYVSESNGRISVEYININTEPTKYANYSDYGVTDSDILMICENRSSIVSYMELFDSDYTEDYLFYYLSYGYSLDSLVTGSRAEKALASSLLSVTSDADQVLTMLTGHGEDEEIAAGLEQVYGANGYTFEELNLSTATEFSEQSLIAIIAAPTTDYTDDEIARLREWLENDGAQGRNLMVFINYTADCPNLYEFLQVEYGIEVTDQLVYETSLDRTYYYNTYYVYTDVPESTFAADFFGTAKVFSGIARQLKLTYGDETAEEGNSIFTTPLLTSPESAKLVGIADALSGSESTDQEAAEIEPVDAESYPIVSAAMTTKLGATSGNVTNVMVCAGAFAAYTDFITQANLNNEDLFLAVANDMVGVDFSVTVSSKSLSETITFPGGTAVVVGLWIFTIILPVCVLALGVAVFLRRRHL